MNTAQRPAVLALDPGRSKCGLAVVDESGAPLYRAIVSCEGCEKVAAELVARYRIVCVVLGNGTGSAMMRQVVARAAPNVPIEAVDESHTSEVARARRVAEERHGWKRLVPAGLLTPSSPYDDLVAVVLAERWWRTR